MTRAIPTPLHRDAALAHESHRHELLDPTTLRWVAELLVELEHLPCAQVAEHLQLVAQSAGRAIDVRWRRDEAERVVSTKRAGGSGRTPAVATEATRRASR